MPRAAPKHKPHTPPAPSHRTQVRDHRRGGAYARGYDKKWERLRRVKLMTDPLCECDACQSGKKRTTPAEVVDHIEPISQRPDLRLEWSNLRSMSKRCHDQHTARTQAFGRGRGE